MEDLKKEAPLLEVRHIKKYFPVYGGSLSKLQGYVHAVDDVSFSVEQGETFGLVGESGCGKSTLMQTIMRLTPATAGSVTFDGKELFSLLVHGVKEAEERKRRTFETMADVGLQKSFYDRYPHEFSGGQRQRVSIARSLILRPKLILCDEPVSALDVSIQSQILNLLKELRARYGLTYIFVSHALNVVRHLSNRICVMYLGKIVEIGRTEDIFGNALHPYTKALVSAIPVPDPAFQRNRILLKGDVASPKDPPKGCRFHTRCPFAGERCMEEEPVLRDYGNGHQCACFLNER